MGSYYCIWFDVWILISHSLYLNLFNQYLFYILSLLVFVPALISYDVWSYTLYLTKSLAIKNSFCILLDIMQQYSWCFYSFSSIFSFIIFFGLFCLHMKEKNRNYHTAQNKDIQPFTLIMKLISLDTKSSICN